VDGIHLDQGNVQQTASLTCRLYERW